MENKYASRKFWMTILVFLTSLALAVCMPSFVENAQVLFNFWVFLFGLYFGGNAAEHYVKRGK